MLAKSGLSHHHPAEGPQQPARTTASCFTTCLLALHLALPSCLLTSLQVHDPHHRTHGGGRRGNLSKLWIPYVHRCDNVLLAVMITSSVRLLVAAALRSCMQQFVRAAGQLLDAAETNLLPARPGTSGSSSSQPVLEVQHQLAQLAGVLLQRIGPALARTRGWYLPHALLHDWEANTKVIAARCTDSPPFPPRTPEGRLAGPHMTPGPLPLCECVVLSGCSVVSVCWRCQ